MPRVPSKQERESCWRARDAYFQCLDEHGLWVHGYKPNTYEEIVELDPTKPPIQKKTRQNSDLFVCGQMLQYFDKECLPSWVWHFSTTRLKEMQKQAQINKIQEDERKREEDSDAFWQRVKKS
ncbi:hypothetical protein EDD86DRAFT_111962 [Gorgonomyces haynaldii]|nr:hypothetical protein EDD86DRAFT_111962 [Gorgonomyces haynaldii]